MTPPTPQQPKRSRAAHVERVLWMVLGLNLVVAAAKFFYGLASGSASMQADGIHSFFDGFGNVVGLISIGIAKRPADAGHPYGHAKFETYGSMVIGVLLVLAAFEVGSSAIEKLVSGNFTANVTAVSFIVMCGTLVINLFVTIYERRQGKKFKSDILSSDAAHTFSDALVSIGVIVGLILVTLGFPAADPIMALIVTLAIIASAVSVFHVALNTLSDHVRIDPQEVAQVAESIPGVLAVHHIRTRGTEAEVYCDLHILVDPDMTVREAHERGDLVEEAVRKAFPQVKEVLVHIEPYCDEELNEE